MKTLKIIIILIIFTNSSSIASTNNNRGVTNFELLTSCERYLLNTQNEVISDNTLCYGYIKGIYELMFLQKTRADLKKEKNFGFQHCGQQINIKSF